MGEREQKYILRSGHFTTFPKQYVFLRNRRLQKRNCLTGNSGIQKKITVSVQECLVLQLF